MGFWETTLNVMLILSFPGMMLVLAWRALNDGANHIQRTDSRNASSDTAAAATTSLASFDSGHGFSSACSSDAGHTSHIGC